MGSCGRWYYYYSILVSYCIKLLLKSSGKRNVCLPCSVCWTQGQVENTRSCRSTVGRSELFTNLFVPVSHLSLGLSILKFSLSSCFEVWLEFKNSLGGSVVFSRRKKSVRFRIPLKRFIIKRKRGKVLRGRTERLGYYNRSLRLIRIICWKV